MVFLLYPSVFLLSRENRPYLVCKCALYIPFLGCYPVLAKNDRLYRAYAALPGADKRRVDPELMAEKLLGLRVVYRRLSRDGSILGITAPESVGVPVLEGGGKAWFFLDGNTILLDAGLLSPWAAKGRRRFTLMHEIGHRLLQGAPSARTEGLADRLASALLMPRRLVERNLLACAWLPGPIPDRRLDPKRWQDFETLAETMERILPVDGSVTITAPRKSPSSEYTISCILTLSVVLTSFPGYFSSSLSHSSLLSKGMSECSSSYFMYSSMPLPPRIEYPTTWQNSSS